jgi:hypothetical protein
MEEMTKMISFTVYEDNMEINVCREMMDNIGYPKLELGLSAMTKDQLEDNLLITS